MFTRGGADLAATAIFIGGSDVAAAEAVYERVRQTFFGPVRVSVLLDPAGDPDIAAPLLGYALMSMAVGEAQLLNICVAPEHRRRGLARQLLDHLLAVARAAAMESMFLEVRPSNASARALYAAYGFAQIGMRRNYYRSASGGEDALVLSLSLSSPVVPR